MSSAPILLPTRTINDFITLEKASLEPRLPLESRILRSRSSPHLSQLQPGFWIQNALQKNTTVSQSPEVGSGSAENLSTSSLSSKAISSLSTTDSVDNCAAAAALLQDSPSNWDNIEDAQCLVYCSQADCLPRLELGGIDMPQVMLDIQHDVVEVPRPRPIRNCQHFSQYQEDIFSSNRAIPARPPLPRASIVLPRVSVPTHVSQLFSFATLVESIALFSGDLAASMVAMYQNHYGVSSWNQVQISDRRHSLVRRYEWEKEMRTLEVDEWVLRQDAF